MTYTANLTAGDPDQPLAWQAQSACRDHNPELWFPDQGGSAVMAKAICASCPVIKQCRTYGLKEEFGIWGGASERDRRKIRSGRDVPLLPVLRCGHPCTLENIVLNREVRGTETKIFYSCVTCDQEARAAASRNLHQGRFGHLPEYDVSGKCRICDREWQRKTYRAARSIPQDAPVQERARRVKDGRCLNPDHTRPLRLSAKYPGGRCLDCDADRRREKYRLEHGIPLDAPLTRGRRKETAA